MIGSGNIGNRGRREGKRRRRGEEGGEEEEGKRGGGRRKERDKYTDYLYSVPTAVGLMIGSGNIGNRGRREGKGRREEGQVHRLFIFGANCGGTHDW
jgi:hypothetical protein